MVTLSLACDLTLKDWEFLELSQITGIILEKGKYMKEVYGNSEKPNDSSNRPTIRVASQDDWDRFGS